MQLGQILAQIYNIGETKSFIERPTTSIKDFAIKLIKFITENNFIPIDLETAYLILMDDLLFRIQECFKQVGNYKSLRLHGNCHQGNILTRDDNFYIVDFDDSRTGPAVQRYLDVLVR